MNTMLTFEAEPLELFEESACGAECHCQDCRATSRAGRVNTEAEFMDEFEELSLEDAPPGQIDCAGIRTDCVVMTPAEEQKVRRVGKPKGDLLDRTQGDQDQNLSLQLTDYDVNDWRAGQKELHQRGLDRTREFIVARRQQIAASPAGVEITISGSASRTGSKSYNDVLSCKRATCAAQFLRNALSDPQLGAPSLLVKNKIRFTIGGEGFQKATCRGRECEVGEFRSVLISVHRPGLPPPPVPIVPAGWDKYRIRCCSFKSESLGEVIVSELLKRGLDALPDPLKRLLNDSPIAKKVLGGAIKKLIAKLKEIILKKAPGVLGKLIGGLSKALDEIPVEFIRDTGVYQIVERDKLNPAELILCYTGFGIRVKFPRSIPGVGFEVPQVVRGAFRKFLKERLGIDGLGVDIFFDVLSGKIPAIESTVPGPFTDFDVDRKIRIKTFEGPGEALKGLQPGTIFVGFSSPSFVRPDPIARPKLRCSRGCAPSIVPVTVGSGTGFEVVAPTKGELLDSGCKCGPTIRATPLGRVAAQRALASRRASLRRTPQRRMAVR